MYSNLELSTLLFHVVTPDVHDSQAWQGHNFSEGWAIGLDPGSANYPDPTHGPTLYVNKSIALEEQLLTTGSDWAT